MIDGVVLTQDMATTFANGEQHKVPYLIGTTDLEAAAIKMTLPQAEQTLALMGFALPKLSALYDPEQRGDKVDIATHAATDWVFVEPARYLAQQAAKAGQPTYRYRFSYVTEKYRDSYAGAPHATDVAYVFGTLDGKRFNLTDADRAASLLVRRYWVNFVKTGDPNGPDPNGGMLARWPRYSVDDDALLEFDRTGGATARTNLYRDRLDYIATAKK
jgi:para-nitrobenzyl esterase